MDGSTGAGEHGEYLAFLDLRDRSGVVQCVVDGAADVRPEYVVRVTGTVRLRAEENDKQTRSRPAGSSSATADVEILARAEPPPFPLDERTGRGRKRSGSVTGTSTCVNPALQRNLRTRAVVNSALRTAMEEQGFVEIETPMLNRVDARGGPVTSSCPPARNRGSSTPCPRAPSSSSSCAWSGASIATTRSPVACGTRT